MKKIILTAIIILTFQYTNAQLNANAKFFKKESTKLYNPIKDAAIKKWGTDNSMVVYMINNQCDALNKLMVESPYKEYVKSKKGTSKRKFFTEVFLEWTKELLQIIQWWCIKLKIVKKTQTFKLCKFFTEVFLEWTTNWKKNFYRLCKMVKTLFILVYYLIKLLIIVKKYESFEDAYKLLNNLIHYSFSFFFLTSTVKSWGFLFFRVKKAKKAKLKIFFASCKML